MSDGQDRQPWARALGEGSRQRERMPWDRCKGESRKAFAAFTAYLGLGSGRSVREAWERHCAASLPVDGQEKVGRKRPLPGYWQQWCAKWQWVARAESHDEYQAAAEQKARDDVAVRLAIAEAEQQATTRKQMQRQAQALLTQSDIILAQCLRVTQGEGIKQIGLRRHKQIDIVFGAGEGKGMTKAELQTPGALDVLDLGMKAAELGQKLYRVGAGEATDITQTKGDGETLLRKLVALMREFVPPERWEELSAKLSDLQAE